MISFKEAFGVEFGEEVQGAGIEFDLSGVNEQMKGRAMRVDVYDSSMRPILSTDIGVSPDGVEFDTAGSYYSRFVSFFAWSVNARVRLWKLKRRVGELAYLPFAGFARTIKDKAIPKGIPLSTGQPFYMTFTDEKGESATILATFQPPKSQSGIAKISRKRTRPQIVYTCKY